MRGDAARFNRLLGYVGGKAAQRAYTRRKRPVMQKILTITLNPALDLATGVDRMRANRKLRCTGARLDPGGGGVNVSRVIHRFGGSSTAFVALGGPTGRLMRELMQAQKLDLAGFPIKGDTRQDITVDEHAHGRQYRLVLPGPRWSRQEVKAAVTALEGLIRDHDYIVASGSLPPGVPEDFYAKLARLARQLGKRLILDTSGAPLRRALKAGVFLVKPNHIEFADLVGGGRGGRGDWASMARLGAQLQQRGEAEAMIVTRGDKGALLVAPGEAWRLQAPKVKVASLVGAGDSLIGAAVLALARGETLLEAARLGVAAAAAAVETPGTELATRTETLRLARRTKAWRV